MESLKTGTKLKAKSGIFTVVEFLSVTMGPDGVDSRLLLESPNGDQVEKFASDIFKRIESGKLELINND